MISFVIPTLNEIKTIEATLQCVASYAGDHEVIVSDGNSTDGTVEVARRYTDNVIVYDKPYRQTIAMARNMGAAAARGEYLVFLDADVVIPDINAFFDTAEANFRSNESLLALTGRYKVFPEQSTIADRFMFTMLGLQFRLQNNLFGVGGAGGEFQMVRADAFRTVGGFNQNLVAAEDMDLFRRLSQVGRTRFEPALTVYHTGRRAHTVGWPGLIWEWFTNSTSVFLLKKSTSKEWTQVR
jgi:glycosyltransferase involved in cell wall biosynthesis